MGLRVPLHEARRAGYQVGAEWNESCGKHNDGDPKEVSCIEFWLAMVPSPD